VDSVDVYKEENVRPSFLPPGLFHSPPARLSLFRSISFGISSRWYLANIIETFFANV